MNTISVSRDRRDRIEGLRHELIKYKPRKIDPNLQRDLQHRWLLPYLLTIDSYTWQRWDYWYQTMAAGKLLDEPIPKIEFYCGGNMAEGLNSHPMRHLEKCLNLIPHYGSWQGWSGWQYFDYFLDWLLFGFGHPGQPELPGEPADAQGACMRLYQTYDLHWQLLFPYDYWGSILAANNHGKHLGFYPTPHNVVKMMSLMLFEGPDESQEDHRIQTVYDPCLGTGRMLLYASNYSLRLFGMDINPTVIKSSLVNGYLYAPWMVKPFPFLDGSFSQLSSHAHDGKTVATHLSDQMAEQAEAQPAAAYLAETEHDSQNQWRFEPILKRRKKGEKPEIIAEQGLLF
jgi:hypothetical protein